MSEVEKASFTAAEYLTMERQSSEKHEFAFGEIFAMTGATARHVGIVSNLVRELGNQLRHRPCQVYSTDLRVCIDADNRYAYPDVVVVCNPPRFLDDTLDTLLNPELIVEVLSESTRNTIGATSFSSTGELLPSANTFSSIKIKFTSSAIPRQATALGRFGKPTR